MVSEPDAGLPAWTLAVPFALIACVVVVVLLFVEEPERDRRPDCECTCRVIR